MKRLSIFLALFLCGAFMQVSRAGDDDVQDLVSRLQKKYDDMNDLSVEFVQTVHFAVTQSEQTFHGKLFMKKGNKYRVDLDQETIVTDGVSLWNFNKTTNQVFIDKYHESPKSFSPQRVLSNLPGNYNATDLGKEKMGETEVSIVKLMPKSASSNVKWIKAWIDPDNLEMRRIDLLDISENLWSYTVSDTRINTNIADSRFRFEVPPGVEVIDMR